jgi:hypothetical protein
MFEIEKDLMSNRALKETEMLPIRRMSTVSVGALSVDNNRNVQVVK